MTEYYMLGIMIVVPLWLYILYRKEGFPCPDRTECSEEYRKRFMREECIKREKELQ